ncbi:MAG: YdbH domain-containing protein, partial [Desulfatitalea sp.]
ARLTPRGSPIHLTCAVESRANTLDLTVTAEHLETARFADLLALFANLPVSGQVGLDVRARCRLQPFGVASLSAEARALLPAQHLEPHARTPLALTRPLALALALSARPDAGNAIQWELDARGDASHADNALRLQRADWRVESQVPRLIATGRLTAGAVTGRFDLSVSDLLAHRPQTTVRCPSVTLGGDIGTSPDLQIQALAELSSIQLALDEAHVELPKTVLEARLHKSAQSDWDLTGELRLADGRILYDPQAVQINQISLRLPVHYPLPSQPPDGEVSMGQMLWQTKPLGGVRGKLGVRPEGLWADLRHASKLFPGLNVQIRSEIGADGATLAVTVPGYTPAAAIELGRISPAAAGFAFQGRIEAEAELRTQGGAIQSTARVRIGQGVLRQPSRQLVLEGIACDLRMEDLIALRSAPRQQLQVADLTLGKLAVKALNIDFQLESKATLFIEKAGLQWCKGMLQTQAFRLTSGRDEVEVTVYCDRLNLAMVMEQLGAAQGSGEGAVSGRIPVRWRNGELAFDNGFLYSTPGQTGTIQLRGTQNLLDGLAPGTPQHTQLDIASEALKDYTYNWAKVELQSQNELLLVSLKLDGKPNRLLPFAYDPQSGGFKRFSGQGQADFQGINIDLNFKTPLREILHYRQLMTPPK